MTHAEITGKRYSPGTLKLLKRNWELVLFILPAITYIFIFNYIPIYGIQLAFKDFVSTSGIWGSEWVGFKHFERFFSSVQFWDLLKNTVGISFYSLAAGFPMPILLALLLNYSAGKKFTKLVQTVTYAPHFISTVVLVGMITIFLSTRGGFVNEIIKLVGGEAVLFMGEPKFFKSIYVLSGIWQSTGWGSILYIAVLSSVDQEVHEAAIVDGASRMRRIWHIDIPVLLPTAVIMLILSAGNIMNVGFEKIYLMQNSANITSSEVISTYVYKIGLQGAQFSYSTAIGLFNNIINFALLVAVNKISRSVSENSLW